MLDEIFAPFYTTEWGRRLSIGALISMSLMLLYTFYSMISNWQQDFKSSAITIQKTAANTNHLQQLIEHIPDVHLFGTAMVGKTEHIPVTSLQLHLTGIIRSTSGGASRVIISEHGAPGKVYEVGDVLESGVRINSITDDGVILENEGQLEKLPLLRNPIEFKNIPEPMRESKNNKLTPNQIMQLPFVTHELTNQGGD